MNLTTRKRLKNPTKFGRPNDCSSDPRCWIFTVGGQGYFFQPRDYSTIAPLPTEMPSPTVSIPQTSTPTAVTKTDEPPLINQIINSLPGKTDAVPETNAIKDFITEHPYLVAAVGLGLGYAVLK